MSTATDAEGTATVATAPKSTVPPFDAEKALSQSLVLFAHARQQLAEQTEKVARMQGELIDLLEASHDGSLRVVDGNFRKIFTVVRPNEEIVHRNEKLAIKVARRYNLYRQLTKTVVNWDAVRALIDSGVFPQLAEAITVEQKPKRPYIKIS